MSTEIRTKTTKLRQKKVFNDKKLDIFINLPSKFVIEKGVEFFEQNNCITFTGSGQFSAEIQNLNNTSIFSLYTKLFSKYQSLSWIVSKLKPKKLKMLLKLFSINWKITLQGNKI